jgi:hypothetical protein
MKRKTPAEVKEIASPNGHERTIVVNRIEVDPQIRQRFQAAIEGTPALMGLVEGWAVGKGMQGGFELECRFWLKTKPIPVESTEE